MTPLLRLAWIGLLALASADVRAIEVCDAPPRYGLSTAAIAIVRAACGEHRLWFRPFIDTDGHVDSLSVTEAENHDLADHGMIAWRRVDDYWRESGTLASVADRAGATSCQVPGVSRATDTDCRAFLIDTPWSAAFVSWVMTRAGLADFRRSARHIDYIRAAYSPPTSAPYQLGDPATAKPAPGDLLCLLRGRDGNLGHSGLVAAFAQGSGTDWKSHCDIVVAANVGGDRTLYLIGGNVLNTVMMRKMRLDRTGRLILPAPQALPAEGETPLGPGLDCTPANEAQCDFNRRDWVALLKLTPGAHLDAVPAPPPLPPTPAAPSSTPQAMPPGFPRVVPPRPTQPPKTGGTDAPSPL